MIHSMPDGVYDSQLLEKHDGLNLSDLNLGSNVFPKNSRTSLCSVKCSYWLWVVSATADMSGLKEERTVQSLLQLNASSKSSREHLRCLNSPDHIVLWY